MKNESDKYWKDKLNDDQYRVLRGKSTEAPFTGTLLDNKEKGSYKCAACGAEIFSSEMKYDSGSGWPSFTDVLDEANVVLTEDKALGMTRTEVACANCGGHLGHVFNSGPGTNSSQYCINSLSLDFEGKNNEQK